MAIRLQRVCRDTLPRLISFSLDDKARTRWPATMTPLTRARALLTSSRRHAISASFLCLARVSCHTKAASSDDWAQRSHGPRKMVRYYAHFTVVLSSWFASSASPAYVRLQIARG